MSVMISIIRRSLRTSTPQNLPPFRRFKSSRAIVKIDGSVQFSPPRRGGIGCYVPDSDTKCSAASDLKNPSPIGTELEAAIEGLRLLFKKDPEAKVYKIETDCATVAALLNGELKPNWWKKHGLEKLEERWNRIAGKARAGGGKIEVANINRKNNKEADRLARDGAKQAREGGDEQ